MSKLTDLLNQALQKKKGHNHVDDVTSSATGDKKKKTKSVPVITGRPMKKAAGRGR
jgi:hypothetical protein